MKTIGFAGTFYTLWDVKSERVDIAPGAWYNKVTCTYYQNLSKNLDEAIAKAGTDNVDEGLRGKRKSFEYKTPVELDPRQMTERERLFRVLLCNDRENLVPGVREAAFNRSLELGFLEPIGGEFSVKDYDDNIHTSEVAYKFTGELRYEDIWVCRTIGKIFIGIV